jgi:hypothetical protein
MRRPKKLTAEQVKLNKTFQNKANYNRILAMQNDKKRFNNCCEIIERFLLGVEKLNEVNDEKITVDATKIELLLRKAKNINLNIAMENSVKKMMSDELCSAPTGQSLAAVTTSDQDQK